MCVMFPITGHLLLSGFEANAPVDSMQGLEIGSHHGSNYGPMDHMDLPPPPHPDQNQLTFQNLDEMPPPPPQDQNQMAAWFDTDL